MEGSSHFPFFPEIPCQPPLPCGQRGLAAQPSRGAEMDWRGSMCARVAGEEMGEMGACGFSHPAVGVLMSRFCLARCFHKPAQF